MPNGGFCTSQESSKSIQIEAFHVFKVHMESYLSPLNVNPCSFKRFLQFDVVTYGEFLQLFAANQNKPPDIVSILVANKSKLLRLFADFKTDKGRISPCLFILFPADDWAFCFTVLAWFVAEDEQFEADKAQVVKEIDACEI